MRKILYFFCVLFPYSAVYAEDIPVPEKGKTKSCRI